MRRLPSRLSFRLYVLLLVIAAAMFAALTFHRPITTGIHTAALAAQVLPSPIKPQPWLSPEPKHIAAEFTRADGGAGRGDIYVIPDGKRRAGLVVFLGANAAGADDPDVINLGRALARAGFAVMYYWSPTMGQRAQVDANEILNVVAAFQRLRQQEFVDPERVGLAGFSVGASFALVAAADPRIADDIAFVNAFGGYYDTADLIAQIAAGQAIAEGSETPWPVDRLTRQVFDNMLAPLSASPAAEALLGGADSITEARERYAELPASFRAEADSISPSRHVAKWSRRTVMRIMHDRGDPLIPVGESRRMVQALQLQRPDVSVYYTETDIFRHVRPDAETDLKSLLGGAFQLYRHLYHIVAVARQPPR